MFVIIRSVDSHHQMIVIYGIIYFIDNDNQYHEK